MRFLKILFWLLLGGLVTAFVIYNGDERITINLWGGLVADVSMPFLLGVVFLAGFLPMLLAYQALKWRMRQRFAGLEQALADLRAVTPEAEAPRAWEAPVAAPEISDAPSLVAPLPPSPPPPLALGGAQ